MINKGMVAAFDFNLMLSYLAILGLGLTAACTFGASGKSSGAAPAMKMPGG
jgi:hypothetical protein